MAIQKSALRSCKFHEQSNLRSTTTLETLDLWPLLTGGRSSEVALCSESFKWDPEMVVVADKWCLFGGGQ